MAVKNLPAKSSKPAPAPKATSKPAPKPLSPKDVAHNANPDRATDWDAYKAAELREFHTRKWPTVQLPKSVKKTVLVKALTDNTPYVSKAFAKASATAEYLKKFGVAPTKSWGEREILDAIVNNRKPGERKNGTATEGRKLISAAVALGLISREEVKGRSEWKAEQILVVVAKYNLRARKDSFLTVK